MSHVISQANNDKKIKKKNSFSTKSSVFKKDGLLNIEKRRLNSFWLYHFFTKNIKNSEEELKLNELQIVDSDLEKLNDWNFNILDIHVESDKLNLIWQMFQSLNFLEKLEIETPVFINFLEALHEKYNQKNNPFHNFDHAFTGIELIFFNEKLKFFLLFFIF